MDNFFSMRVWLVKINFDQILKYCGHCGNLSKPLDFSIVDKWC